MLVAFCDDDGRALSYYGDLASALGKRRGVQTRILSYDSPKKLLFAIEDKKLVIDILVIDVSMPSQSGIEVARVLRERGFTGLIIFLTLSSDYTMEAFDVGAFNYVVKDEAGSDVANRSKRFEKVFSAALDEALERTSKYVTFNGLSTHINIPIDSIRYFEVQRRVITIHYNEDDEFQIVSSLTNVEDKLVPYGFVRVHRAFLVNRAAIETYNSRHVVLFDGTDIPMGRGKLPFVDKVMEAFNVSGFGIGDAASDTSPRTRTAKEGAAS